MDGKSQLVRLLDVVLFGPFMLHSARRLPGYFGVGLTLVGWGTILYNGYNLIQIAQAEAAARGNALGGVRSAGLTAPGLRQLHRYNVNLAHRAPGRAGHASPSGRHPRRAPRRWSGA